MSILWRVLRILAATVIGLYGVGIAVLGGKILWPRVRLLFAHSYYVEWDYLSEGLFFVVVGLLVLLPAAYVLLRRQARAAWLLVSLVIFILAAMVIPSMRLDPTRPAQFEVHARVRNVRDLLHEWALANGRFPANQEELLPVAQNREKYSLGVGDPLLSRYARAGERLPYQVVYVADATGPHLPQPPADRPAVIYCAVSADLKHLWLTATGLEQAVDGPIIFLEQAGRPLVEEVTLEATPRND